MRPHSPSPLDGILIVTGVLAFDIECVDSKLINVALESCGFCTTRCDDVSSNLRGESCRETLHLLRCCVRTLMCFHSLFGIEHLLTT